MDMGSSKLQKSFEKSFENFQSFSKLFSKLFSSKTSMVAHLIILDFGLQHSCGLETDYDSNNGFLENLMFSDERITCFTGCVIGIAQIG